MISKKQNELISIIVPVYNVESYLKKCIDSILAQDYDKFELLLIDDGSTDNSGKICDEYIKTDSRIQVYHKTNGGLSDARNYGLDRINGRFVTFIDSDDWIDSNFLKQLYNAIISTSSDICQCNFRFVYDNGEQKILGNNSQEITILSKEEAIHSLYEYNFNGIYIPACGKLYSSQLFTKFRFKYGRIHEDNFMACDIIVNGNYERIAVLQDAMYNYYQRSGGLSTTWKNPKEINDKFVAHLYYIKMISKDSLEYRMFWNYPLKYDIKFIIKHINESKLILPKEFYSTLEEILRYLSVTEMKKIFNLKNIQLFCFFVIRYNAQIGIFMWGLYVKFIHKIKELINH